MDDSLYLLSNTLALVLSRENDFNVLPHVHTILAFLWSIYNLTVGPAALIAKVLSSIPWGKIVDFLNTFIRAEPIEDRVVDAGRRGSFLQGAPKPLPEDYLLRGLVWCRGYFVSGWFDEKHDEESRLLELPSTNKVRIDRVMRLSICLSQVSLHFWCLCVLCMLADSSPVEREFHLFRSFQEVISQAQRRTCIPLQAAICLGFLNRVAA